MKAIVDENGEIIAMGIDSFIVNGINADGIDENYRFDFETKTWIYDPIIMIPQQISKLQCVKRLLDTNRYNDLMSALDADTTGVSRILFDAASMLSRDSNMVNQLATALGFSNEDTDAFFVEAEKIIV